ncbi:MAG: tetratricopeptide repeat protein [Acidithiobacillales bacterium]
MAKRESLIASAEKALQKGKVDSALKDYLKVLEEVPGDINVLNKVGDLFVRLNRNEESIPYFTRIAEHYSRDGFFLKAIAIYKKINKLDPARLDVYERLAELYGKQGLTIEAKSQYQVLADYHAKHENVIGAIGIYQKMAAAEPQNIQTHVKLADLYTQARRTPEALKEYAVVAALLRERGAADEALQVYDKALKLGPDNGEILRAYVPMLLESGRVAEARDHLKRALEATPRSVSLFLLAADTAMAAGDMEEARRSAAKAQAVEPDSEEVLQAVLRVHVKAGSPGQALGAAVALSDRCMRRGEAKKALGILAPLADAAGMNEGFLAKLIQIAEAADGAAAGIPYRSRLAELWRREGRIEDAADALRILTRLAPDSAEFRARLSQLEPAGRKREDRPAPTPEREAEEGLPRPSAVPPPRPSAMVAPAEPPGAVSFEVTGHVDSGGFAPPAIVPVPTGEFILELDDEQLVRDPGSTGPVPAALRRASQVDVPAAARPVSSHGLDVRRGFESGESTPQALPIPALVPTGQAGLPPVLEEAQEIEPAGGPAAVPRSFAPLLEEAVEVAGEAAAAPAPPPPVEAPAAPAQPPVGVDTALAEIEVFRRYGLLEKAIDQLRQALLKQPKEMRLREKLFELCLEAGKKSAAVREAEILKERYRADGRPDRVLALDALLVERTSADMGEALEESVPGAFTDTSPGGRSGARRRRAERRAEAAPAPVPPETTAPPVPAPPPRPGEEELAEVDFCLDQGMVVDASEKLRALEARFPGDALVAERRQRLEEWSPASEGRPALEELLTEDFESVLDAELGRALTDEMARGSAVPAPPELPSAAGASIDESALFSDEQEFFNFAGDLQAELRQEAGAAAGPPPAPPAADQDVPLEEIFREFKKGVEQQLSPEDYETHYNLGIAYKEMALVDEAIGEFQRAAKSPQHAVECCSMLGLCFLEKGLPQLAIKWYRKGLESPGLREEDRLGLLYDLGNVYFDVGERDEAYRTFLEIYGSDANFRDIGERLRALSLPTGN